ncbi:hypothetical protein MBLNU230_g6472t1 [Neophaeotheca triangularis]
MPPPASSSPQQSSVAISNKSASPFVPRDRGLPPISAVTDLESLTNAYVAFILYCNPQFSLNVDASTLRTSFQTPPKSDNKEFDTYHLYELIEMLDSKEIKTWGQLALDLGVEAPDMNKGQSVQKVQQYTVRLKRWLNAMHINAFFDYLLGKDHPYFVDIPTPSEPYPAGGRDDVLPEGDLALRALDPTLRPKRGRRRNSVVEAEETEQQSTVPNSTVPQSAHPDSFVEPWTAASVANSNSFHSWGEHPNVPQSAVPSTTSSHQRWRLHGPSNDASTPHPMTAHPGSSSIRDHIDAAFDAADNRTASSNPRKRRRNGPTVSSAWTSGNAPGSRPRGRPPAHRGVQDGAFGTFHADPSHAKNVSQFTVRQPPEKPLQAESGAQAAPPLTQRHSDSTSRPHRLSLQVPQHTGGTVRLATPPQVLLNGEANNNANESVSSEQTPLTEQAPPTQQLPDQLSQSRNRVMLPSQREVPGFAYEALKRILTSDLLRAHLSNRTCRLTGEDSKQLAEVILTRLAVPRIDTDSPRDDIARLTAASWLGLGGHLNVPLGPATSSGKRIVATKFCTDAEGYEEIVAPDYDGGGETRETFDVSWSAVQGSCNGTFELKGLCLGDVSRAVVEDTHDALLRNALARAEGVEVGEDNWLRACMREVGESRETGGRGRVAEGGDKAVDWKAKYLALEFGTRLAKGELERVKERLLEKVLDAVI